jgi:hypothetical protein
MLDEAEVRRVLATYARAVDRHDMDLLRSVFHPGAVDEHGPGKCGGVDQLAQRLEEIGPAPGLHHLTVVSTEFRGDECRVETYFLAVVSRGVDHSGRREVMLINGRYLDRFDRRDGSWKISHRRVVNDVNTRLPHQLALPAGYFLLEGEERDGDASYAHLEFQER